MSSTYGGLTVSEIGLLVQGVSINPALGLYVGYTVREIAARAAEVAAARYDSSTLHNGEGDAFRHAYWNILMVKELGPALAESFATAHEDNSDQPAGERAMDLHNNAEGRRIAAMYPNATNKELADHVRDAIRSGRLITSPSP